MSTKPMAPPQTRAWVSPQLSHRGSVAQLLKDGMGKLSITGQDPGEMRCEKPHASECA